MRKARFRERHAGLSSLAGHSSCLQGSDRSGPSSAPIPGLGSLGSGFGLPCSTVTLMYKHWHYLQSQQSSQASICLPISLENQLSNMLGYSETFVSSLAKALNSAEIPCVLWGQSLLNVHGIPSIIAVSQFARTATSANFLLSLSILLFRIAT